MSSNRDFIFENIFGKIITRTNYSLTSINHALNNSRTDNFWCLKCARVYTPLHDLFLFFFTVGKSTHRSLVNDNTVWGRGAGLCLSISYTGVYTFGMYIDYAYNLMWLSIIGITMRRLTIYALCFTYMNVCTYIMEHGVPLRFCLWREIVSSDLRETWPVLIM